MLNVFKLIKNLLNKQEKENVKFSVVGEEKEAINLEKNDFREVKKIREVDPVKRKQKYLQVIANRTKKFRIRKKLVKRIVDLYE